MMVRMYLREFKPVMYEEIEFEPEDLEVEVSKARSSAKVDEVMSFAIEVRHQIERLKKSYKPYLREALEDIYGKDRIVWLLTELRNRGHTLASASRILGIDWRTLKS